MKYYSLNGEAPQTSFKEAVIRGIAPDKGLYFPEQIKPLPKSFFEDIQHYSKEEIAFEMIQQFIGNEIPASALKEIIQDTVSFDFPLVSVTENIASLELFHGPTMAFKDVGARFMARCLGYFSETSKEKKEVTVLVATSGDTGGAVANGFLGVEGVKVVILYPSGKVSDIQEKQLTTLGQNITALEVEGSFDDCQAMVKKAFLDESIIKNRSLTSANSINVARWLPQSFYFAYAYQQRKDFSKPLVFSVPSGNFGNICAGMVAQRLGMPVAQFVASVNSNDVIPSFMESGTYSPKPSVATISNAMDVGDPSNFIRIQKLFNNDFKALSKVLTSYSFSDKETKNAIQELYDKHNYIADPHGAVGYLGLQKYLKNNSEEEGIFLETAHPIKFLDVVENSTGIKLEIPKHIQELIKKKKKAHSVKNYTEFKSYLLQS
ncbi:threonine synthase [Cochleicola gelatinilyticus]|uniref:Threonine synthase n=1 Tax=Cochleicola gelatinilyticus TaxID=1763537 RepID=A0A167HUQ0_9FLAO|nr:threonine synthase [Cochleicola gelatinilyticus]OAB78981.1 threonine synthase [Cochleicola gelatinilyticus]